MNADEVRDLIDAHEVDVVIVGGSDMPGVFRAKRLPRERFYQNPEARVGYSDYLFAIDVEEQLIPAEAGFSGWWPSWETGLAEIYAAPDLSTFRLVPWLDSTAVVLCDYQFPDGRPIELAPRHVLTRVTERAKEFGFDARMGPEFEFFLFQEDGESLREKGYRDLEPLFSRPSGYGAYRGTLDEHIIRPLRENLAACGIPVEGSNPEGAGGQYEIQLIYGSLPEMADRAFLFKHAVKEMAAGAEMLATFMAKASPLEFGSSSHVHQSLWGRETGRNLFWDAEASDHLSDVARHYIGGQLATLREFTAVFAPTINSYKRLLPESAAPTNVTWGYENRTTALRVIHEQEKSCRVEHRVPGGDVNPYLALAAALAGGLYGIENAIEPPPVIDGNAYEETGVEMIPKTLAESIPLFEASEVAREYLGDEFVDFYAATLRWEIEQARSHLTDWEVKRYMEYV